jgi:HAD superfamily hydrolase (TIGR01662 family)
MHPADPRSSDARRFDAVLFDLGSTLIYFQGQWPEVLRQSNAEMLRHLHESGFALEGESFLNDLLARMRAYDAECGPDFVEYTTAYILKSLLEEHGYPDVPDSVLRGVLEARYAVSQSHWLVEEDTVPTLQALRQAGYRLGIISNAGDDGDVQTLVDKAGIRSFFEVIVTSAAQGIRKPNPRIFHTVLDRLGVAPGRAAMVGDTLGADILGAQNAGVYSIWITRRADVPANRAHRETIHPDAVITGLAELPGLLEKHK